MRRSRTIAIAAALGFLGSGLSTLPAVADDANSETYALLQEVAPAEVVDAIAPTGLERSVLGDAVASVSEDMITVEDRGKAISLVAPADDMSSSIEAILMEGASALFAITAHDKSAPSSYDFELVTPPDSTAALSEDGSVVVTDEDGAFLGGVAAPWARDASGSEIDTWFTLHDNVLTQHLDVTGADEVVYPVIADPWLGKPLISSAWVTDQGTSNYVVNAVPTAWGRQNTSLDTHFSHVAELKQKLGSQAYRVTATIDNQFICHVFNQGVGGGATYNMESWRGNMHWTLQTVWGCNPP